MIGYLIGAIALLAIGFGSGWQTHGWKTDAETAAELKLAEQLRQAEEMRANEIADRFEKKLANLRIINRTINNEVRHETEKTVYSDCVVPPSGVELLNRAISAANADPSQPDATVRPAPSGAKPADDGGSAGMVDRGSAAIRGMLGAPSSSGGGK